MRCYLFDIDGTVADLTHRLHHISGEKKNWAAFFDACEHDMPIQHIIDVVRLCAEKSVVVFVSGRSDRVRPQTERWLAANGVYFKHTTDTGVAGIYMRKDGDHRPDHIVKAELLAEIRKDGFDPIMAFDDRNQVVEMWRANGIPCAQVAPGDF